MRSSTEENPLWIEPVTAPERHLAPGRGRFWIVTMACVCTGSLFAALPALLTTGKNPSRNAKNHNHKPTAPPDIRPAAGVRPKTVKPSGAVATRTPARQVTAFIRRPGACSQEIAHKIQSWLRPMLTNIASQNARLIEHTDPEGCVVFVRFRLKKSGRVSRVRVSSQCSRRFHRVIRRAVRKWRLLPGCDRIFTVQHKLRP